MLKFIPPKNTFASEFDSPEHCLISSYVFVFCFVHPIFRFWFLVAFGDEVTKILRNLCLHFARQDGQDGKKWKENHATKVTKIQKTKRRNMG